MLFEKKEFTPEFLRGALDHFATLDSDTKWSLMEDLSKILQKAYGSNRTLTMHPTSEIYKVAKSSGLDRDHPETPYADAAKKASSVLKDVSVKASDTPYIQRQYYGLKNALKEQKLPVAVFRVLDHPCKSLIDFSDNVSKLESYYRTANEPSCLDAIFDIYKYLLESFEIQLAISNYGREVSRKEISLGNETDYLRTILDSLDKSNRNRATGETAKQCIESFYTLMLGTESNNGKILYDYCKEVLDKEDNQKLSGDALVSGKEVMTMDMKNMKAVSEIVWERGFLGYLRTRNVFLQYSNEVGKCIVSNINRGDIAGIQEVTGCNVIPYIDNTVNKTMDQMCYFIHYEGRLCLLFCCSSISENRPKVLGITVDAGDARNPACIIEIMLATKCHYITEDTNLKMQTERFIKELLGR